MNAQEIGKLGIRGVGDKETTELFEKMITLGWIDGAGRQLPWAVWQKKSRAASAGRD